MGSRYLDWLAHEARIAYGNIGLDPHLIVEVDRVSGGIIWEGSGWVRRARSSGGYSAPAPLCVMWHHTAVGCLSTSRAGLLNHAINTSDGKPVANVYLWCDGTAYILAGGATNTNGAGLSKRFSRGTVAANTMNSNAIGMEIVNDGIGGRYPEDQINAAFALSNAWNLRAGNRPDDVCTHHDYAPTRKIDPATASAVQGRWQPRSVNRSGSWNLDDLRSECLRRALLGPTPPDPDQPEDEMTKCLLIQGTGGSLMVAAPDCSSGFDLWSEDYNALAQTGDYHSVKLRDDTMSRIPRPGGAIIVDVKGDGVGDV